MLDGDKYRSEMRLVPPPAVRAGGRAVDPTGWRRRRVLADAATLREVIVSPPIRDEIAPQLWARCCPKVCLSRGSIKRWALAPEPRRQS